MSLGLTISNTALIANARPWVSVQDDFNRADGSLGTSSFNSAPWTVLTGNFIISNNKALAGVSTATATPTDTGIAYIDTLRGNVYASDGSTAEQIAAQAPAANVEISANVSPTGGDALYFRIKDANNWHRVLVETAEVTDTKFNGYYEYTWTSSRGPALFKSYFKDPKEYFPTLTTCVDTSHDHTSVITSNPYVNNFDPENRKWGPFPYAAIKRGISQERGSKGDDVRYLQGVLKYFGYTGTNNQVLTIDGIFGTQTTVALKKLQTQYEIVVDGFAWNLQTWLVIDALAFQTLEQDTAAVRGSESINSFIRRILLYSYSTLTNTSYDWPNITVTGTSPYLAPESAYREITHTHPLLIDGCRHTVDIGSHTHYVSNTYTGASTPIGTTTTSTRVVNKLRIQKCVDGVITNLTVKSFGGYDNLNTDPITHIKVTAIDNYVGVSINKSTWTQFATWEAVPNPLLSYHGIGRGASTRKGTAIDNFSCTPIEHTSVPTEE